MHIRTSSVATMLAITKHGVCMSPENVFGVKHTDTYSSSYTNLFLKTSMIIFQFILSRPMRIFI